MPDTWNKYEPTAARPNDAAGPRIRPSTLTFDAHSHVAVPQAAAFVQPHLDPLTVSLVRFQSPETRAVNDKQEGDVRSRLTVMTERVADLDRMGVDMQLVMPSPFQCYYTVPLDIAVQAAILVNDGLAEWVGRMPDRFIALGTAPMVDGKEAAKELERCVTKLSFKGVQILTNVTGKELSDLDFAPFWAKAEQLGAVIAIHPNGFTDAERLQRYYLNNLIGNPLETAIALHYLIFDGVLERHPNLKIFSVHGGGYAGAYWGRMDHAWGARSDCNIALPKPPTSYLRKIYVDSVVFTAPQLRSLVETFGADHVMMGTDYPFDMGDYDPVSLIMSADFNSGVASAVAGLNAKRLFRF
jgi:aminocarboxymuconate-semialdehyde decarboxylase